MKSLRWLPLTYIAGLHGFILFAPYAVAVLLVRHTAHLLLHSARSLPH